MSKLEKVAERQGWLCAYCNDHVRQFSKSNPATLDHVVPQSRGGASALTNLVMCHRKCNQRKGDLTPEEAGMPIWPNAARFIYRDREPRPRTSSEQQQTRLKKKRDHSLRWQIKLHRPAIDTAE